MTTKQSGLKVPPQFEPHVVAEFRIAVNERREHLGRKMAALMPLKDEIKTARANDWKFAEIAYHLSKGAMVVDSTTVARFCRDHLGEKPVKKSSKKGSRAGAVSSPTAAVPAATATKAKDEVI